MEQNKKVYNKNMSKKIYNTILQKKSQSINAEEKLIQDFINNVSRISKSIQKVSNELYRVLKIIDFILNEQQPKEKEDIEKCKMLRSKINDIFTKYTKLSDKINTKLYLIKSSSTKKKKKFINKLYSFLQYFINEFNNCNQQYQQVMNEFNEFVQKTEPKSPMIK